MKENYPSLKNLASLFFLLFSFAVFSQTSVLFEEPDTYTWTVPCGVTSLTIQAWGGGASGGAKNNDARGGGGGGGYVTNTYPAAPGQTIAIVVGAGGPGGIITDKDTEPGVNGGASSYNYNNSVDVVASGGSIADADKGGAGGIIIGLYGAGSIKGGDGSIRVHKDTQGGGGGGSGPSATNAIGQTGGISGGGDGGNINQSGFNGIASGGGGGGKGDGSTGFYQSGNGANGQVIITWSSGTNTWNGSVSSDWNAAGNWCIGVPDEAFPNTLDVLIPAGLTNYPVIFGEPATSGYVENIVFEPETTLNVIDNSLRVTINLTLNGIIDLEGESQLVQDMESTFSGEGSIEIDQQGTENSFRYNYWSSPVNSRETKFTIDEVLRDGDGTGTIAYKNITYGASYDWDEGDVDSSPIRLSTYWMYVLRNSGTGYNAWFRVGNTGEVLVGEGYTMKGSNTSEAQQNYTFVGKPNNGDITLPLNATFDYLVGNPYPSAIDAEKFILDNPNTTGALYFWEHYGGDTHNLGGYQAGYATRNLIEGVAATSPSSVSSVVASDVIKKIPGPYIAVGQAFFVVGDLVGGQIEFKNSQRKFIKESSGNSIFMKTSIIKSKTTNIEGEDLRPKFRIGFDAPKISHRQLLLGLDERATKAVDWGFDAEIYEIFADDMYWMLDGKKYVIQGTNVVGLNSEVPLGIQLSKEGVVKVKIDALENVDEDIAIYLKDKLTGETHNITSKSVQLNLKAGKYLDRFALTFKIQKLVQEDVLVAITDEAQILNEGIHIFMNNNIGNLLIKNNSDNKIESVSLFNYLGQTVQSWNTGLDGRNLSLPINASTGAYLVNINTIPDIIKKKIIVNN